LRRAAAADISVQPEALLVKDKREDPTLLLVIAAGVAVVLIGRWVSRVEAGSLEAPPGRLAPVAVALLAAAVCLLVVRAVATRRTLRSRVALAVVPADELDPSLDQVLRFAAQLSRSRRRVLGWLDRRASAIRIALTVDSDGRLAYLIEAPAQAASVVRSALRGFEGVEPRDPGDLLGKHVEKPRRAVRAELVLARPSVEPLERLELDPDPLQPFAAALKNVRAEHDDRAVICVDLLPASPGEAERLRRRLLRQARRRQRSPRTLGLHGNGDRRGAEPVELAERRAEARALDAKLKDAGALFRMQVLVRCEAADAGRAKATLRSLLSAFDQLAGRNWLRPAGIAIGGLAFLGSDVPGRRWWLDRRVASGLFRPARQSAVTAREIAGFLKPPTVRCRAGNVLRSGALVAPAPPLPEFRGQRGLIPLGRVATEQGERLAAVRAEDTFFSYVAGRSRYGKTELAIAQFTHLVRCGHGGLFLDPHEDALERIKGHLDTHGLRERVVEINLARPAPGRQEAWNLFELSSNDPTEAERRVEAIVDAFASALRWDERNTRALTVTTQAAQALAGIAHRLPDELAPTIFQLPTLLSDERWREACLPFLPTAAQRFWTDRFPRLSEEAITPVTNLIDRLRASTPITALLGQSRSTYRVREAMDQGLIVLACPGSGGTRDRLIANLLVFDLLHAAKGRAGIPPAARRAFWVFLDEVQTYDGASSGNLAALLEQTAKYGIRAFLLNQNPERLAPVTLNAVTTNRSHLLATALNARAAALIAKEWGGAPNPAALTRLPRYRFLCQVTHRGELSQPFQLHGVPAGDLLASTDANAATAPVAPPATREPALAPAKALAHLETLDERILKALTARRRRDARGDARAPEPARVGGLDITDPGEGAR
jgi:hypothetical protein